MDDLFSFILKQSTSQSLLFHTSNINDKLEKERITSVYYARSYYYLIYIQFFLDSEIGALPFGDLIRDILIDPNVYLSPPDYSSAQIFPITLKRFHTDPLPVADYLLNLLNQHKSPYIPNLKIYLPKNFIAFCNFPALYSYFTDPELNKCAYEFLKNLISLSELGCEDSPRQKKNGATNFTMPKLKMNSSLSTSELSKIAETHFPEDSPLLPISKRYSLSMAQIVYNFVLSYLLSSFSFTDILWHRVNEKIGKMVFLDYTQALNAIKVSIKESSPLLPVYVYQILYDLNQIDQQVALDIVYDFLMITFQLWQKHDGEGLTFTCNSTILRVLATQYPPYSKKIYTNEVLNVIYGRNREKRNSIKIRDIGVLESFLYNNSRISVLPSYINSCGFGNLFLCVSYFDLIIYSQCFCDNSPKMVFQQRLQTILNEQYPKSDKRRFYPFGLNYYPNWSSKGNDIESPFFGKYLNILKNGETNEGNDVKKKLINQFNAFEVLIEKKRNLQIAKDLNSSLDRLRKNAFSFVLSCFFKDRRYTQMSDVFHQSIKYSNCFHNPSSLFLQLFQSLLNVFSLPDNYISKRLRSSFILYQEKISKEDWELYNDYNGNKYLFQLASMLTTPRIGHSLGDAFRLFNYLFKQCFIVSDYYKSESVNFTSMITFIVKVSRYEFFLDIFIFFSMIIFTNQEIVEKIDLDIIHNWEKFFCGFRSNEPLFQDILNDDQLSRFVREQM
ncbi:hypothetical protein M9Y10_013660 [Tritrichomonas musculus]|uniref:Uncharacterized protein n=1 Tax=Tritrichomonas musculus TaxID=1915356 RepID=A0ABR2L0K5_9EUKA